MIAYKFLSSDRVGLFSGVRWPEPGTWLEADAVERCASGIHALHAEGLLGWIDDELWTCELDGIVEDDGHELVAERGRLLERVAAWNENASRDFARACAARGRDHVVEALRAEGHDDEARELAGLDAEGFVTTAPGLAARLPAEIAGLVLMAADTTALAEGRRPRGTRAAAALAPRSGRRRWRYAWCNRGERGLRRRPLDLGPPPGGIRGRVRRGARVAARASGRATRSRRFSQLGQEARRAIQVALRAEASAGRSE